MAPKKRSEEENMRRAKIRELLNVAHVASIEEIRSLFRETIAEFIEKALEAELEELLGRAECDPQAKRTGNSRNGYAYKTLRTSFGDVVVAVPRDRKGIFVPKLVAKNQVGVTRDIEEKIFSMYAKGMTTSAIEEHLRDIYGISVSASTVSRITDKVMPSLKQWLERPLGKIYSVVFMDALRFHVRKNGQTADVAVYIAIGIGLDGRKEVLGMWPGESETAEFWLGVLRALRQRGVEDILISCTDSLIGLDYAIRQVFPDTEIQNCIVHQLRYSTKSVSYKDLCALMRDLKQVYMATDENDALKALSAFESAWDKKYPYIARSWRSNWRNLCAFLKYGRELRHLVYTTNTIEGFNRQLRKVTKAKTVFPTEDSLLKMLYMATMDITRKWHEPFPNWDSIKRQLEAYFGGRMSRQG